MAADILLEMLFEASPRELQLCARRLADKHEAPARLLRYLSCAAIEIAEPILSANTGLDGSDLSYIALSATPQHRLLIAARKPVPEMVCETLAGLAEPTILRNLIANPDARLSDICVDRLVTLSRDAPDLCRPLLARPELTPAHAMAMFWWTDRETRRNILQRHAADRRELINNCSDMFALAAKEGWNDPLVRKTLQLIERRQRNRAAIEKSPYDSLEHVVEDASRNGLDPHRAQEMGYLAGVKPVTIAKILSDRGGEPLAVLCKATGLRRNHLKHLWRALRRPFRLEDGSPDPIFAQVLETYLALTVARAQTTLRYWNWSLSSAFSPETGLRREEGEPANGEDYSAAMRTARLVFGG